MLFHPFAVLYLVLDSAALAWIRELRISSPAALGGRDKGRATVTCLANIAYHVKVLCKQEQAHL